MPRIERLHEDLVNKIAAGEVVERPASVVKELVENALDAGARSVLVEIDSGGKSLVRVRDDGHGMGREDAALAVERHATSKLRELADLQRIATHGFRGEALPSIASVSHLLLRTRDDAGAAGTEVEIRHGRLVHVRDAGHPRGTTVEVRDLFGGVPARRKFLRSDATETSHVAEAVTQLAVARAATGFVLASGKHRLIDAPPVDGLAARLFQLFGSAFLEDLVPVDGEHEWVRLRGLVSRPDRQARGRGALRLYVNGRPVRDRALTKAVLEAYRAAGVKDPRAEAFLFLEVPQHVVDVNVHPTKAEVRFAEARVAWTAVERTLRAALSSGTRTAPLADTSRLQGGTSRVEEAVEAYIATPHVESSPARQSPAAAAAPAAPLLSAGVPSVLGQHRNSYIVATDGEDIILVDQHTAHERVRFETILERLGKRAAEAQMLLTPLVTSLEPGLQPLLEAHAGDLLALGFDVEAFGGGSVRLRAVPALLEGRDPALALAAILRGLLEQESAHWAVSGSRDRLAATLACHSAVRAGQLLSREMMAAIVRDLGRASHPTMCPHGRPTMVRIPREDVSRWFGRSGWRRQ